MPLKFWKRVLTPFKPWKQTFTINNIFKQVFESTHGIISFESDYEYCFHIRSVI